MPVKSAVSALDVMASPVSRRDNALVSAAGESL